MSFLLTTAAKTAVLLAWAKSMFNKSRFKAEVKTSLYLSLPLAAAQLAQSATAFVDTIMMGLLGSQTIAAGGLGAASFNALLLVSTGIVTAVSPLAAEAYGAEKKEAVGRVVRQGLVLAMLLAMPLILLVWNAAPILRLLGQQEQIVNLTETYLRAIVWSYVPALLFAVLRSFVAALSQPRIVMVIVVMGTLLNVMANYVLMFGKLGFPALGLAGIGWASTLSFWSVFIALTSYILLRPELRNYRIFQHLHRFDRPTLRELLKVGLPIGALVGVEAGLFTITTFLMGQLGTVTLAAHQIALQTASIAFMIPLGISFATTVRVGQLLGQKDPESARLSGFIGIGIGSLFMATMGILFWFFPKQIVSLYLDVDNPVNADVVSLAKSLLGVAAIFQLVDGIQAVAAGALRGLKDTRIPLLIGIIAYWCIGLTSGYWLGMRLGLGSIGLWCGLAIGLAIAASVLTWRFWQQSNRTIRLQQFTQQPELGTFL